MEIAAYMMSCSARETVRAETLARLAATDWASEPVVVVDVSDAERPQQRQEETAFRLLELAAAAGHDFVLFLEDDLDFNAHLRHNLEHWRPLLDAGPDGHLMASLYDPGVAAAEWDMEHAFSIAHPELVYGSQAFVLSRSTVAAVIADWLRVPGMQDIKISRIAAAIGPIHYHRPSLVQHIGFPSTWGGNHHFARDYSADWRAPVLSRT